MSDEGQSRLDGVQPEVPGECPIETHPDLLALSQGHEPPLREVGDDEAIDIFNVGWQVGYDMDDGCYVVVVEGIQRQGSRLVVLKAPQREIAEYAVIAHNVARRARRRAEQDAAEEAGKPEATRFGFVGGLGETKPEGPVDS